MMDGFTIYNNLPLLIWDKEKALQLIVKAFEQIEPRLWHISTVDLSSHHYTKAYFHSSNLLNCSKQHHYGDCENIQSIEEQNVVSKSIEASISPLPLHFL